MKKIKKPLALFLAAVVILLSAATPALAASKVDPSQSTSQKIQAALYMMLDSAIRFVGKILNKVIPGLDWRNVWQNYDDYITPDSFYKGEEKFETQVSSSAVWSMGYAYGSLLEGLDVLDGSYGMAGRLQTVSMQKPTSVIDDQGVSTYAVSDGVSGIVVQAVVDGYGLARGDVLKIRERLSEFAKEKNIISINISTLHQHSLIDTLGMGVALIPALLLNPGMNAVGADEKLMTGKNQKFMDNLYKVVTQSVIDAVDNMREGTLYYSCADASDLMYDKRKPDVFDGEIHRLRFDPADETANEIWVCEAGIHCTGVGASGTDISSDYPYYFKQYIKETVGADVVYVQGAELAITDECDNISYNPDDKIDKVRAYGTELAKRVLAIENEAALEPVLNIRLQEVAVTADNPVLILAVREGIVDSVVTENGTNLTIVTEIGYMELGNKIGIVFVPGEIAPEIIWGGAVSKEESWTKESWDYPALEAVSGAKKLLCFGLNNDQIGYILPDNDIRSMFTENEEINAASVNAGSVLTEAYTELFKSIR